MKSVIGLLVRLYPLEWRERYGTEFEALLEDARPSLQNALDVLLGGLKMQLKIWSPGRIRVAFSILGMLAAAAIFSALPSHYVSRFKLMVASVNEAPSLEANRVIQQSAFDRQALASIIQDYNLYPRDRGRMSQDSLIDEMTRNIHVMAAPAASAGNGNAITFDVQFDYPFDYPNPDVAQRVNEQLIGLLLEGMEGNLRAWRPTASIWFHVLEAPIPARLPERLGLLRFACVGMLAGLFAGLLVTSLMKSRTAGTALML